MASELVLAGLEPDQIDLIRKLEQELGDAYILAFEKPDGDAEMSAGIELAKLSEKQVQRIQEVETSLADVYLLAFGAA